MYKGSEHGFSTIAECAGRFDQLTAALVPDAYAEALFAEAYGNGERLTVIESTLARPVAG